MKLPILAFCDGWLKTFDSLEAAEIDMEPIDVENGEWQAFDAVGQRLKLMVEKRSTRGIWSLFSCYEEEVVRISEFDPPLIEQEQLRELIIEYVKMLSRVEQRESVLSAESLKEMPFEQLVKNVLPVRKP